MIKEFGKKIKCKGYFKIVNDNSPSLRDLYDTDSDTLYLPYRKFIKKSFDGIIIGKRELTYSREWGINSSEYGESQEIVSRRTTLCYKVAYDTNKTRFVPVDECEVKE